MRSRRAQFRLGRLALFVLVAFQLALALPLQSIAATPQHAAGHSGCVTHHEPAAGHHDCCQAGTCQCHCFSTPATVDAAVFSHAATSRGIPVLSGAQFVAPLISELLRPPIA